MIGKDNAMRVLVIGCGSIGMRHMHNLNNLGIDDLMAFDTVADQREHAQQECGARPFDTLDAALQSGADVVFVTTPTHLHVPVALQAASAGCHLFIEKPLSHTEEGLNELIDLVQRNHLVTMVGCNMRFHPGPSILKKLLEARVIGTIIAARLQAGSFLPRWRPSQDYRQSYSASAEWGGAILDAIHEIDLALWFLGPARLLASAHLPAWTIGLKADGLSEMILQHTSGALSSIHLNFVQRDYRRACQLIGSEGTLYWDYETHVVHQYGPDGNLSLSYPEPAGWQVNQMYLDELVYFVEALKGSNQTMNSVDESLAALEIALAARSHNSADWTQP